MGIELNCEALSPSLNLSGMNTKGQKVLGIQRDRGIGCGNCSYLGPVRDKCYIKYLEC